MAILICVTLLSLGFITTILLACANSAAREKDEIETLAAIETAERKAN